MPETENEKYINQLSVISSDLANNDKVIIEKADGTGTKIMSAADLMKLMNTKRTVGVTGISTNSNLNSYTTPGEYYCNSNTTAATLTNCPTTRAFRLTVEGTTSPTQTANIRQILKSYIDDIYVRCTTDGGTTWSDWNQFWGSPDKPFLIKGYSYQYTLAANSAKALTTTDFGITAISGYYPLGFALWNTGHDSVLNRIINATVNTTGSNTTIMRIVNTSSSSVTATASVKMIFIPSSFYRVEA